MLLSIFTKKLRISWILSTLLLFSSGWATKAQEVEFVKNKNIKDEVSEGLELYEQGKFAEAAKIWQTISKLPTNPLDRALSLSYLSLALQELGNWQEAEKTSAQSLTILNQQSAKDYDFKATLARVLNHQGSLKFALGKTEDALDIWQLAETQYQEIGDLQGEIGTRINQAQALQNLGLYRRAQKTLTRIETSLETQTDSLLKVESLHSLGLNLQLIGELEKSQQTLNKSLAIAQKLALQPQIASILFSLGNTYQDLQNYSLALKYYQQAEAKAIEPLARWQAQMSQLKIYLEEKDLNKAETLIPSIQANFIERGSRETIYAQINFSELLLKYQDLQRQNQQAPNTSLTLANHKILVIALEQSKNIGDRRAQSYALGQLGKLYEKQEQWSDAFKLTEEALKLAQTINASEIAYQWEWQKGRIFCQNRLNCGEKTPQAINAYREAVKLLKSLRSDLVASKRDVQFSFKESVEPIYRELVQLLLTPSRGKKEIEQNNLKQAREVIENLQLAELDNFFRQACLKAKPEQIERVDPTAAVLYPIILPDRLAVILSLPGQQLKYYETREDSVNVENTVEQLLESFHPTASNKERLRLSERMYQWLIAPGMVELQQSKIQTLVFVLDGGLRNLPISALYDGKQYLIEQYSLALTPGLQLLQAESLKNEKLQILAGGVSESNQGFAALPGVREEISEISSSINAKVFLNEEFTNNNLEEELQLLPFPVVHLATHGQFSSKRDNTYIITWNDRINVEELDRILRRREQENYSPIQLLVLSACQTATGDKRAALGLAGVALQSGARSTLATLWSVSDNSTSAMMSEFYKQLNTAKLSKAEAVRQAQLYLLKQKDYNHPFYWAPFVLVGNWL
jgi:CHAT domain-containing protein